MQNPLSGQEFGKYKYDFGKVMPATVQTPQAGGITRPWLDLAVKLPASLKLTGSSELSVWTKLPERQEAVSLINPTRLFISVGIPTQ